jgi:PAS domain S-box-containing protein
MTRAGKPPIAEDSDLVAAAALQRAIGKAEARPGRVGSSATPIDLTDSALLNQMLQTLPAALYTTDAGGRITFYNEAAAALWGRRPQLGTNEWWGFWRLYWPDGTVLPYEESPMAVALKEGRAIHGMETAAERPDGTRVPFLAYSTPLFGASGEVAGAVNMLVHITERKPVALAAQRLAAIVESSDDAIVSKDLNGIIMTWNLGAQRLFGYSETEVIGKPISILIPADRQDEEPDILARIRRGERIEHFETVRQRKDGSLLDISLTISPVVGQSGRIVGASKIARDISERKEAEKYRDVLFGEMKHRVKNTLALAAAICRQTFHSASDEEHGVFASRLHALGNAHDILSRQSWEGARLDEVVIKTMEPHRTGQGRIHISGPEIAIGSGKAVAIALALHELATNAVKYGALSRSDGNVHIDWETFPENPGSVRLH